MITTYDAVFSVERQFGTLPIGTKFTFQSENGYAVLNDDRSNHSPITLCRCAYIKTSESAAVLGNRCDKHSHVRSINAKKQHELFLGKPNRVYFVTLKTPVTLAF